MGKVITIGRLNASVSYSISFEECNENILKSNRLTREELLVDLAYKLLFQNSSSQKLSQQAEEAI